LLRKKSFALITEISNYVPSEGLLPPTSGTAFVNGFDIRSQIGQVRGSLGLCPQHDVLFDELTVEEHIRFFSLVKDFLQLYQKMEFVLLK